MPERFTPFYEWAAEWPELDLPEALILSRVKMWGNAGCYESYTTLAQKLKLDRSTVIRAVKRLLKKELLMVLYKTKHKRILFFNVKKLTNIPLFQPQKVVARSYQSSKGGSVEPPVKFQSSGIEPPGSGTEPPEVVAESHLTISSKQLQDIQNRKNSLCEILTTPEARPMAKAEFQKRRQQQLNALGVK